MPNQHASLDPQHEERTFVLTGFHALLNEARHSQIHLTAWRTTSIMLWSRQCQPFCHLQGDHARRGQSPAPATSIPPFLI